jgi:hypothetical protein
LSQSSVRRQQYVHFGGPFSEARLYQQALKHIRRRLCIQAANLSGESSNKLIAELGMPQGSIKVRHRHIGKT